MFELKRLSPAGVEAALAKVERYRLLNEPWHAESICRDVLAVEPDNTRALVMLILSLTDQFGTTGSKVLFKEAHDLVGQLEDKYQHAYYEGIVCERRGQAQFEMRQPGCGPLAYEWYQKAMQWFAQAEELQPPNVENAKLRWNTCARMLMKHESIRAPEPDTTPELLE